MPAVARANNTDTVFSRTGTGRACRSPITTSTGVSSSTVFAGGIPVVIIGDIVAPHPAQGCGPDVSALSTSSSTVFANGQGVGRIGDEYTPDNIITSGFPTVFVGG
jgi:uncharacterized Zn-binding protein involved in type VI secretion